MNELTLESFNGIDVVDSRQVAEVIGKKHKNLVRDIRKYCDYLNELKIEPVEFNESKIGLVDFFIEGVYTDAKGEERLCYLCTEKGCEMIAHKLTGKKGVIFTALYINAFHKMKKQQQCIDCRIFEKLDNINDNVNYINANINSLRTETQEVLLTDCKFSPIFNGETLKKPAVRTIYRGDDKMNENIERLKPFLIDYIQEITTKSKGKDQYICPLCGSGTGKNHSGAFTVYPENNSYYCFACDSHGDIFNLYGEMNGISDFPTLLKELQSKYGITDTSYTPQQTPKRQKKTSSTSVSQREEKDYTKFFSIAEQHLYEIDYLTKRGLSVETQQKFHCGYVANYQYSHNSHATPAVIIPTSNTSYMWRSTTENIKQKRGAAHILNPTALKNKYCFVVEGEIDCMSIDECGFSSVGLGSASNIKKVFEYASFQTVLILALDNDKAGCRATVNLAKLCDEYSVPYITAQRDIWGDCKDANELLVKDKIRLVANLQEYSERALKLDKDQWLRDMLERRQADSDWRSGLTRNFYDNAIKNSLINIHMILENDDRYKGKIRFNELKQLRSYNDDDWNDIIDSKLKLYLEEEYDVTASIDNINHACNIIADKNSYHPIREYLNSVQWDGIHRIKSVFTDFLGATDNIYTQSVAIVTFVGGAARIFDPGVKFDTCTTLVGKQGTGKSKFLFKIAVNPEWFTDGVTTFDGKDFYESIQGKWIIELGEGTAFQKSIKERCKQAIASQQDTYREPYARHPKVRKRQCIFLGTTNNYDFLKDETGDRRYYPIDVNIAKAAKNIDKDLTPEYVAQLWAEAVHLYKNGQSIYIYDSQVVALAEQEQRKHFDESPLQSDIYNFLEIPITTGWYNSSLEARRIHIRNCQNGNTSAGAYKRDRISVKEIACELYGYELNQPIDRRFSLEITRTLTALGWNKTGKAVRIAPYGVVKIFCK
ncbi:MAG: Rha family transcriptional regulator [Ruminococcus sp.]|nr:Rha family transcriptional regulator [Ruminococcus sp.]